MLMMIGPVRFEITPFNASPGMSAQEVAHAVRRELENATKELFRGVYADTGMRFT